MRPLISSGPGAEPQPSSGRARSGAGEGPAPGRQRAVASGERRGGRGRGGGADVRVRRLARGADDGFSSPLVPGLRSSEDADRLASELAFAEHRLDVMERDPVGLWSEVAAGEDIEERTWLAFLIAYVGIHPGPEPFAAIGSAWVGWAAFAAGEPLRFEGVERGPRGAFEPARAAATLDAYRAWVARSGSQQLAFTGEESWTAERRFERLFERLGLPGLHRDARFELLVSLGHLGLYPVRAGRLQCSGENEVTWAAKRAFGIGDQLLLERRAAELAEACGVALEALDLGLYNWGTGERFGAGVSPAQEGRPEVLDQARAALGL